MVWLVGTNSSEEIMKKNPTRCNSV